MGLFGDKTKQEMKEFEQMRQAWRPAERTRDRTEANGADGNKPGQESTKMQQITTNISLAPAPTARPTGKAEPTPIEKCASVVSTGSTWEGNLTIEGSVRIDGRLRGEVDARGTVHVSEGANVEAKVRAAFVIIAGTFSGQVQCSERLEIMPTGRSQAELTTRSLVVHEGAFIEGQVHMVEGVVPLAPGQAPHRNGAAGTNGAGNGSAKNANPEPVAKTAAETKHA